MKIRKKIYTVLKIFPLLTALFLMPYSLCQAASATITLSADTETVAVGDEVTVSIRLSSEAMLGDFTAYITYNADILEFKKNASFIAGGEGLLKLTDTNSVNKEKSRKYIMKFTAKAIGSSEIAIKDRAELYDYEAGLAMSVSSNRIELSVSATETASDNANLKSLKISPGTLSPEFDKNTTEYTADLNYDEEKLIVSAQPEDENADVTIEGNESLSVGANKIIVKVKAESGDIKQYIVEAVRKQNENNETDEINDKEEANNNNESETAEYNSIENNVTSIGKLQIIKAGEELYIQNGFRYRITEPEEDAAIPDGYVKTSIILNDITVTAFTLENDLENDFLLLYAVNEDGDTGFYQYDRKEATIQRYTNDRDGSKVVMTGELLQSEEYKAKLTTMGIVMAILGSISIIMSVALIRIYLKKRDNNQD